MSGHASGRTLLISLLVCGACLALFASSSVAATTTASATSSGTAASAPHVMTIMMENTDYGQISGAAATPYLNELEHQYANFTQAYGWTYPSLPNYVELQTGSTHGITTDCDPGDKGCAALPGTFMEDQLAAQGISWHAFFEGDVSGCDSNSADDFKQNYDVEHNPWRYFSEFPNACKNLSGFTGMLSDLDSPAAADYDFVVPDLNNDGGDNGTMSSGDTWLSATLPRIMRSGWYRQGGQIVIMYDSGYEDQGGVNGSDGGHIALTVVSAHTRGLGLISTPVNTAGVLRSLEHAYGTPYLGDAADAANGSLGNALVPGRPTGPAVAQVMHPALAAVGAPRIKLTGVQKGLAFNGVHRFANGTSIAVGENASGQGMVWTSRAGAIAVPGSSNLESVSCPTATRCLAVGLATAGSDDGVVVPIVDGRPQAARVEDAFYGLYGVDCASGTHCVAVGYSTATIGDAVTTITNGNAGEPKMVPGGGEWLNAVSCPTSHECYATGLVNYAASVVPISNGVPHKAIVVPDAWYASGIDCPELGHCVVVGANKFAHGTVTSFTNGKMGTTDAVESAEYLYGVGCVSAHRCVVTGASSVAKTGYSHGQMAMYIDGRVSAVEQVPSSNGLGQVSCGSSLDQCVSATATDHRP